MRRLFIIYYRFINETSLREWRTKIHFQRGSTRFQERTYGEQGVTASKEEKPLESAEAKSSRVELLFS